MFFKTNKYSIYFADYQNEEVDFIMFSKEGKYMQGYKKPIVI